MAATKLDKLTQKREQLNAQIQALKSKEAAQKRKEDTKRKILIGGVVLKMLKTGEMPEDRLTQILDKHLDKDADRALFDLPEMAKTEAKEQVQQQELIGAQRPFSREQSEGSVQALRVKTGCLALLPEFDHL